MVTEPFPEACKIKLNKLIQILNDPETAISDALTQNNFDKLVLSFIETNVCKCLQRPIVANTHFATLCTSKILS